MANSVTSPVRFHPDAPRPRFLWQASLPTNWVRIDTHPEASPHRLSQIAENYIPGHRLKRAEQKLVLQQLEQLVKAARDGNILLTLILPGLSEDGQATSATLLLRWYDSSPEFASLRTVEQAFSTKDATTQQCTSPKGTAYVHSSNTTQSGPISQRRTTFHHQALLPIPSTTWTLVISGSAPDEETGELLGNIVKRVANSVQAHPETLGETFEDLDLLDSNFFAGSQEALQKQE